MKHILVPTDFSETAAGAFRFALDLARNTEAEVTVLHVYHPAYDLSNPYLDIPVKDFADFKQRALNDFIQEHYPANRQAGEVRVHAHLEVGFAGEDILRHTPRFDLVVMGTTGAGMLLEKWFGSVSSYVAQHARKPVLLVPMGAVFHEFRRVMYTSNFDPADEALLLKMVSQLELKPDLVHFVHADQEKQGECRVAQAGFKQLLNHEGKGLDLKFVQLACEEVLDGLQQYASENSLDLIIMGTVHRSFLERLFHRSITRQMIRRTTLPLLILHYED